MCALVKGRGAVSSPQGRHDTDERSPFFDGWETDPDGDRPPETQVDWEVARRLISSNDSPDIPFTQSVNPYRGCEHGCVYCFARPGHANLGLSPGLDFETRIFAKKNAAALLRAELARPGYVPSPIALGTSTDVYQPFERSLRITRSVLELLAETRHPVSIVTKSAMVERDLDLLAPMAAQGLAEVIISITSLRAELTRKLEPRAAAPARRLRTIDTVSSAGVPVAVLVAPVIPGLTDHEFERILKAAADRGASGSGYIVLRLPHELKQVFGDWLDAQLSESHARKVRSLLRQLHGGKLYNPSFFARQKGSGPLAQLLQKRHEVAAQRLGLNVRSRTELRRDLFEPPAPAGQQRLF